MYQGLQSFATCLRNPTSALETLKLSGHSFDDDAMVASADAFLENKSLHTLWIPRGTTDRDWLALSNTLFNTSSMIQALCDSNHTLHRVDTQIFSSGFPGSLQSLLDMNGSNDKTEVARQKILQDYFLNGGEISITAFVGMNVQVWPQAISWIEKDATGHPLL